MLSLSVASVGHTEWSRVDRRKSVHALHVSKPLGRSGSGKLVARLFSYISLDYM